VPNIGSFEQITSLTWSLTITQFFMLVGDLVMFEVIHERQGGNRARYRSIVCAHGQIGIDTSGGTVMVRLCALMQNNISRTKRCTPVGSHLVVQNVLEDTSLQALQIVKPVRHCMVACHNIHSNERNCTTMSNTCGKEME
jgi:hypothetical protein